LKYLLAIAIEDYSEPKFGRIPFAVNDAKALAEALQNHGYYPTEQYIMLNEDATKTAVESRLKRLARLLTADDQLVIYYAGHGCSISGRNVLTARDSESADLESTTIGLADVFDTLGGSACKQVMMFLDAGHEAGGGQSGLIHDELSEFFSRREHSVCFAACQSDESSYSSGDLKHGVWTWHLLEALRGEAPLALERGSRITAASLQNFLITEAPRTLRINFKDNRSQTPWMCGSADELLVADISDILAVRAAAGAPESSVLGRVSFAGQTILQIKQLIGFGQSHRVPKQADSRTGQFVEKIGALDVEEDLTETYRRVRDALGLKRRDLEKSYTGGASGSLITPAFDYHASITQDPNEPSDALLQRCVTDIRDPEVIMSDEFQEIFDDAFDTIEFNSARAIDIEALIDRIEDANPDGLDLSDYDDGCTFCDLSIDGIAGIVKVTANGISVMGHGPHTPRQLAELFKLTWSALLPTAPTGMLDLPARNNAT
jgi:hypothetical protein